MSDYESDGDEFSVVYSEDEEDVQDKDDYYDEEIKLNGHEMDEEDVRDEKMEPEEGEPLPEEDLDDGIIHDGEEEVDEEEEPVPEAKDEMMSKQQRRTTPYITKYEYSYLISQRAIAIENDSPLMNPETKFIHAIDIAREETELGINPIIIRRVIPPNTIEEWKCSELKLPEYYK